MENILDFMPLSFARVPEFLLSEAFFKMKKILTNY